MNKTPYCESKHKKWRKIFLRIKNVLWTVMNRWGGELEASGS